MAAHSLFLSKLKPEQRRELEDRLYSRQNGMCFICEDPIDLEPPPHCIPSSPKTPPSHLYWRELECRMVEGLCLRA